MADQDSHNFPSPSNSHRLPTTSATQALKDASSNSKRSVSTGLRGLDGILSGRESDDASQLDSQGGISIGDITEVHGPPGVGKSSFAINIAANALRANEHVVWVDTTKPIYGLRLKDFLSNETTTTPINMQKALSLFHHWTAPTLPHLLALLAYPSDSFPPLNTSLLVVDDISSLFSLSYRNPAERMDDHRASGKSGQVAQWASGRRWVLMDHLITELNKLAVTKRIAILLTSQMTTRIHDDARAVLHPSMSGKAWERGITARIVLFRDWLSASSEASYQGPAPRPAVHFAGVTKAQKISYDGIGKTLAFRLTKTCLDEISQDTSVIKARALSLIHPTTSKRKFNEVADSDSRESDDMTSDREFGWDDEDTTL